MKSFICTLAVLFLLGASAIHAQTRDSIIAQGVKEIYSINFTGAEETFRKLIANNPKDPAGRFFLAMVDWWRILIDPDNESYDEIFYEKLEDIIYQCDELLDKNENDLEALFFKGGAIGFRGRLRGLRESWLKAADDGREALPIVKRGLKLEPDNKDFLFGLGIYNYYADVIPDKFPLVKPFMIFFPSGNKNEGIEQLKVVAEKGKYSKYESRYFLMTLYMQMEQMPENALPYAQQLHADFPDNPSFERWLGRIHFRLGNNPEAIKVWSSVLEKIQLKKTGYHEKAEREATYYVGSSLKDAGRFDSAITVLERCITLSKKLDGSKETGFYINALLYQGMSYDALGNRSKALEIYDKVLDMKEYGSSHYMAKAYKQDPFRY